MTDSPSVDRTLAVVRAHFRAPPGARTRTHAELVARGALPSGGEQVQSRLLRPRSARVARSTAALLTGLGFMAGFWLGRQGASEPRPFPLPATTAQPSSTTGTLAPSAAASPPLDIAPKRPIPLSAGASAAGASSSANAASASAGAPEGRLHNGHPEASAAHSRANRAGAFNEELALLQRAERALRAGEPELALAFLDDIDRRYPKTRLVEERAAARLMARCVRAEPNAPAQAELFLEAQPTSVYRDRVRALCKLGLSPRVEDGSRDRGH